MILQKISGMGLFFVLLTPLYSNTNSHNKFPGSRVSAAEVVQAKRVMINDFHGALEKLTPTSPDSEFLKVKNESTFLPFLADPLGLSAYKTMLHYVSYCLDLPVSGDEKADVEFVFNKWQPSDRKAHYCTDSNKKDKKVLRANLDRLLVLNKMFQYLPTDGLNESSQSVSAYNQIRSKLGENFRNIETNWELGYIAKNQVIAAKLQLDTRTKNKAFVQR